VSDRTDGDLVRLTGRGNTEAYGELVSRYQGHVYGLAYSLAGNWDDAQDIAQETFIRAYVNLDQLREPARFAPWLRRVTFGVTMNWLKAHQPDRFRALEGRVDLDTLEVPDFAPGPPEVMEKRELAEAVHKAIATLPAHYRLPLTMFHLDGLSYQKVADFLDIPLGTAKSLIHRARAKLREALAAYTAEEVIPMVQEVFNEHKLPEGFARKVLENVPELRFDKGDLTFAGTVAACMEFMGEQVTYDFVMGVSGGAFKLLWHPKWCPSSGDIMLIGEEVWRRTFGALGYHYEHLPRTNAGGERDEFRRRIMASIDAGRPVLAAGVVGPPEKCVVAGYEEKGDVLLGHSYFHDGSKGYFRKSDWYDDCWGLTLIGDKTEAPGKREILRSSLEWAVELARTPERNGYVSGLAAYDAWAAALRRDEDFPEGDPEALKFKCLVHANVVLCVLLDARRSAAAFLTSMGEADHSELPQAARVYHEETSVLEEAMKLSPFEQSPENDRRKLLDAKVRAKLADLVLAAKAEEERALALVERALSRMAG